MLTLSAYCVSLCTSYTTFWHTIFVNYHVRLKMATKREWAVCCQKKTVLLIYARKDGLEHLELRGRLLSVLGVTARVDDAVHIEVQVVHLDTRRVRS